MAALLFAAGVNAFSDKKYGTSDSPGTVPQYSSPADAIQGAGDAVNQTQNLQDRLNQAAQKQLGD